MPKQDVTAYDNRAEYLAGAPEKLGTLTLDSSLFTADGNGDIILQPGTILAKPSATDYWGPYETDAGDGRETATNNVLVLHDYVEDLEDDDYREVACLLRGVADGAKLILADGTAASTALKDELRSRISDVILKAGT